MTRGGRASATRALTCIGIGWLASTGLVLHAEDRVRETRARSRRARDEGHQPADGVGLGVYTEEQAARGRMQDMQTCSSFWTRTLTRSGRL